MYRRDEGEFGIQVLESIGLAKLFRVILLGAQKTARLIGT